MENFEQLVEKYKSEMMSLASQAVTLVNEENEASVRQAEVTEGAKGRLKVRVFTGNEAFPVMSALVKIFDGDNLVFQGFTDQSGTVEGISLSAPDKAISESPGNRRGYSTYKVLVSHPGFNTVILENVPVFDSVESIQPVNMEPINGKGSEIIRESEPFSDEEVYNA